MEKVLRKRLRRSTFYQRGTIFSTVLKYKEIVKKSELKTKNYLYEITEDQMYENSLLGIDYVEIYRNSWIVS